MRKLLYCLLLVALCSCHKQVPGNRAKIEQLADRTCRAINYRKQRFSCANQIRFAQDTLIQAKTKTDSDRLQKRLAVLLKEKVSITNQSLALADTIRLQLDSLMPYTDKKAQKAFSASLDSILTRRGCKDENKGVPLN